MLLWPNTQSWIGLSDILLFNEFAWVDGSPYTSSFWQSA
jgi:hypothetical protein